MSEMKPPHRVAVVGMAGRFPGARNVEELWTRIVDGTDARRELGEAELIEAGVSYELLHDPRYVRVCYGLNDVDVFDARLFEMSPREASLVDPAHRLFLESCFIALEDAG